MLFAHLQRQISLASIYRTQIYLWFTKSHDDQRSCWYRASLDIRVSWAIICTFWYESFLLSHNERRLRDIAEISCNFVDDLRWVLSSFLIQLIKWIKAIKAAHESDDAKFADRSVTRFWTCSRAATTFRYSTSWSSSNRHIFMWLLAMCCVISRLESLKQKDTSSTTWWEINIVLESRKSSYLFAVKKLNIILFLKRINDSVVLTSHERKLIA